MGQMLGGLTGGLLGGGGWLMFAIFVWQLPWFWSATFNDSCWWLPLALLLTVLAVGPLLVGLGVGLDGVRKVKLASIPPQFRNQVTEFRGDEDSWSQIESTFSAASGHIEKGSKGEDVRFLQQRLNEFGAEIGVDGSFGNQTDRAVRNFQTDHGLTVDGIVGPKTMAALQRSVNKHHEEHLEKGSSGDEVRKLQELLNEHGGSLSVDGSFGDLTYREVVKFQTDNGLTVDGVVGLQTWGALTKSEETDSESDGGPSISLNKESFGPQELIAVTFENGPGNPSDWIGIYRKEAPSDGENHHGNWVYSNGSSVVSHEAAFEGPRNGTVTFSDGMGEGGYEARFFANNGYELLASAPFEVSIDDGPTEEESEEIQLLKQMREAGRSADECRLAGFSAEQCRDAGYSADELLELCFPPYGEPRVYNWNGYQGSNIICEGKFGILTFVHPGYPEDIRVEYLDGSTNSVNTHAECLATDGYGSPSIERGSVRLLRWDVEIEVEPEVFMESDSELADITGELEVVASAIEELAEDPDASIDELRALADSHLEERMSGLSDHQKNRLRGFLGVKLDSIEEKAGRISSDSGVSKGIAAAGGAAAITAAVAGWAATHRVPERAEKILEDGEVGFDEVREQISEIIEVEQEPEPEPEPVVDEDAPEMPTTGWTEPDSEPTPVSDGVGDSDEFVALGQEIDGMLTYSEQANRLKSAMEMSWDLTVEIGRVEHTTGIGLGQEFRYGKTIVGKVGDSEVAIAFPESRNEEITALQSGQKGVIRASIKEYQSVLKRFEMLAE